MFSEIEDLLLFKTDLRLKVDNENFLNILQKVNNKKI